MNDNRDRCNCSNKCITNITVSINYIIIITFTITYTSQITSNANYSSKIQRNNSYIIKSNINTSSCSISISTRTSNIARSNQSSNSITNAIISKAAIPYPFPSRPLARACPSLCIALNGHAIGSTEVVLGNSCVRGSQPKFKILERLLQELTHDLKDPSQLKKDRGDPETLGEPDDKNNTTQSNEMNDMIERP